MMPLFTPILDRLREVVARQPERVAVRERGEVARTYARLWAEAGRLAAALRGRGVGREQVVGLAINKSAGWLVGALGAWRAGAAFLPLDPRLPPDRLAAAVRDSALAAVVAEPELAGCFERWGVPVLDPARLADEPLLDSISTGADDLAYVIFTSGSIGRPKGVLVTHRGIVPLVDAQIPAFGLGADSQVLWLLSPSFDASLSDVLTALVAGATLCIEDPSELASIAGLVGILGRRGITHLDLPPALLRVLDPATLPPSIETLIVGGEPSPPEVIRRWAARCRLVNVYGPTEATVCTSLGVCSATTWDQPILGDPIAGVTYVVLDADLAPVAPGTPGELAIAGPCLARGYLDEPSLTAAKFIEREGVRLYRTGDRVVVRPDGAHVFLGRVDRQVKVRGLLVEPEEVEARLLDHPEVVHAAVVKRPLTASSRSCAPREGLVAFAVARDPARPPGRAEVRAGLARSLPSWMIPQRLVWVAELPRRESGKVDLAALAALPLERPETTVEGEAMGPTAEALASVWAEVLGLDAVDPAASFEEQGGDSLTLLEAVALAYARGQVIPPALLAEGRTCVEIAQWLDDRRGTANDPPPGARAAGRLRADVAGEEAWQIVLDRARARPAEDVEGPPRSIFLTGATGHLGARLLGELLARTDARFSVLVRADSPARGLDRVRLRLREHGYDEPDPGRIRVVPGDVGQPRLGMTPGDWDHLAADVDTICHNAAAVHLVAPYEALRAVNVLGTREVVRLQATGRRKRLHHASTLSVFVATDRNRGLVRETDDLGATRWVHGGYAQTKWAAEWLVRATGGLAGPATIHRLGLITGDSGTGRSAPGDFLALFVRGLVHLGAIPRLDADLWLDVTPVDFAARALAELILQNRPDDPDPDPDPATFHLSNPRGLSLGELVTALRARGVSLAEVEPDAWRARIEASGGLDPAAAATVLALCRSLPDRAGAFPAYRTMDLFQATAVEFDRTRAVAALAGSGIAWPEPGNVLLDRYLAGWGIGS